MLKPGGSGSSLRREPKASLFGSWSTKNQHEWITYIVTHNGEISTSHQLLKPPQNWTYRYLTVKKWLGFSISRVREKLLFVRRMSIFCSLLPDRPCWQLRTHKPTNGRSVLRKKVGSSTRLARRLPATLIPSVSLISFWRKPWN